MTEIYKNEISVTNPNEIKTKMEIIVRKRRISRELKKRRQDRNNCKNKTSYLFSLNQSDSHSISQLANQPANKLVSQSTRKSVNKSFILVSQQAKSNN